MKTFVSLLLLLTLSITLNAQIEKVIVEKYYISDSTDATDTTGGKLAVGSTTYRIFIDLLPGYKIIKLYGNENHRLQFGSSDSSFFNNKSEGQTVARNFNKARFSENTVALDTWLTLGQIAKASGSRAYFGVPKKDDKNGSIIGGTHNDGGSARISKGLLTNASTEMGIALITADGIDTSSVIPKNPSEFFDNDTTIFNSNSVKEFISNSCTVNNDGVMGVDKDSNQVLIAQLTTKGTLSFELNVVLEDTSGNKKNYVAVANALDNNDGTGEVTIVSPYLIYPLVCGCLDPNYLEYNERFGCNDESQCKTKGIVGCMDPDACNYDPKANIPMPSMCCYPGYCNDRDISIVCPALFNNTIVYLYPNPANASITLKIDGVKNKSVSYSITNSLGEIVVAEKNWGKDSESISEVISLSSFQAGIYNCKVTVDGKVETHSFSKQ